MYEIIFTKDAAKQLNKIPKKDQQKILKKVQSLSNNPRPPRAKALQGKLSSYSRIRSGNFRVIYAIEDDKLVVLVVKIAHRKEIYD